MVLINFEHFNLYLHQQPRIVSQIVSYVNCKCRCIKIVLMSLVEFKASRLFRQVILINLGSAFIKFLFFLRKE